MLPFGLYTRVKIEGIMPERALLRLKREGISLYKVEKTQKNTLFFLVKRKDIQKVFAIYPNLCYNKDSYHPYTVTKVGEIGLAKGLNFCKKRAGFLLGGLAFCALTLFADGFVFGVEWVGDTTYRRESLQALEEAGVKPFARYPEGEAGSAVAKMLRLDGVEFCSVKKVGHWVRVEIRTSPFSNDRLQEGVLYAKHSGTLLQLTVLRGTPLKKAGDSVALGEPLVGNWFTPQEGEQVCVEPIARARIACVYEGVIAVPTAEEAFAEAYLTMENVERIDKREISEGADGFLVRIEYTVTQTVNF